LIDARRRSASRLGWFLFVVTVVLLASSLALAPTGAARWDAALFVPTMISFALVGAFLASRRNNPIAWLFLSIGIGGAIGQAAEKYATSGAADTAVPGEAWAAWLFTLSIEVTFPLLALLLLLFPHGRVQSAGWRWVTWLVLAVGGVGMLCTALSDVNFSNNFPALTHPVGLVSPQTMNPIYESYRFASLFVIALCAAAMVIKLRRSTGEERLQRKWFSYAASLVAVAFLSFALVSPLGVEPVVAFVIFVPLLPISAGLAILKYRLYDIDVIINRTLVYGALSATLSLAYFGLVVILQQVLRPLTSQSDLAVAGSTLAVAALFRPAGSRIQALIDRRFYRAKYDAVRTLEAFSARLRDEVDLDALRSDLLTVVAHTMQPAHASLWLKE